MAKSQNIETPHDPMVSMVKAVLIMLMVIWHSSFPGSHYDFTRLFRMPAFFFLSGYLFKEKYFDMPLLYIKRKVGNYYVTYVKWGLVFLALHQLFVWLGFVVDDYGVGDYLAKLKSIFTFSGTELLLGGFWFLKLLFYASIMVYAAMKLLNIRRPRGVMLLSVAFVGLTVGNMFSPVHIPTVGCDVLISCAFFAAGYAYRNSSITWLKSRWTAIACLVATIIISFFYHASMDHIGIDVPLYYVVALVGTLGIIGCVAFIPERLRPMLDYVGSRTIYILTFHMLCFKIVSALKIWHLGMGWERLADFPVIEEANDFYWIAYALVGILVPLGLLELYNRVKLRIFKS